VDKAVALLKDAGYTADKPLEAEFNWPLKHYGEEVSALSEVVKSQLEKSGLIKVTLKSTEWSTYIGTVSKSGYPFFLLGWFPDYPDTDNYLTPWADSAANAGQGVNYKNADMDKLLADARATSDKAQRTDLYAKAQAQYAKDAITVPLLIIGEYTVYKDGIVGADKVSATFLMSYQVLAHK